MKKILVVNKSFDVGGIQSSMINMVNELSKHYAVDLFIYNPSGVMKERLSEKVNVIPASWRFLALGTPFKQILKTKSLKIIIFRFFSTVWTKAFSNKFPINCAIKHQNKLSGYDLAISFHQEQKKKTVLSGFSRVVDRCIEAKKKVAWLHYDCKQSNLDSDYNEPFYKKMDVIMCVSKSLAEGCKAVFPSVREKVDYCYNFINYDELVEKSKLPQTIEYEDGKFICYSACRLAEVKAIPRAIHAFSEIFKSHPDLMWYIAGDGPEKDVIESVIYQYGLEGQIILLGNQSNPYSYMRNADLVMNVSYHEAAPMIYLEAKALGVPVFATRTASSDEVLMDGVNSFICENDTEKMKDAFEKLMNNMDVVKSKKITDVKSIANKNSSIEKISRLLCDSESYYGGDCD